MTIIWLFMIVLTLKKSLLDLNKRPQLTKIINKISTATCIFSVNSKLIDSYMGRQSVRCRLICIALLMLFPTRVLAEESLSFIAEHLIEVPMDMRYLAFPLVPIDDTQPEWRLQGGIGLVSGGPMQNQLPMIGLQYYFPYREDEGFTFSFFYDEFHISGDSTTAIARPEKVANSALPQSFNVQVNNISGSGFHSGFTSAYVLRRSNKDSMQFGLALEQLNISHFDVEFSTQNLPSNFDGAFSYAGVYNAFTPFMSYQWAPTMTASNWVSFTSLICALPLPRVGFEQRFIAPGIDVSSSEGKHIPDPYIGANYSFENSSSNLRIDAGAAIFSLLVEPLGHKEISTALSISLSKSW
jgi:hypothetical protein